MTPITDDTKWRCSGCGAESIATERTCDCPTSCLYKLGRGGTLKDGNNPSLIARIEAAEAARDEAIRLMSEASRVAGEWKGRYKAAGYPGTLDGWIERATAAEGQLAGIDATTMALQALCDKQADLLTAAEGRVKRLEEALTPSGATKAAYIGEFRFGFSVHDSNGDEIDFSPAVPWTTIKEIMAAIRARAALEGK